MKLKSLVAGIAALVIAAACSATPEPSSSLLYVATRSWSNGIEERVEVFSDGKTVMTHGDYDERVTLPGDQMSELAPREMGMTTATATSPTPNSTAAPSSERRPRGASASRVNCHHS